MAGTQPTIGPIELRAQGFEDTNFIAFQKLGEKLLVVGLRDNVVALFEPDGSLAAKVENLSFPLVFGATGGELLLVSGGRLAVYDLGLQPKEAHYPTLTFGLMKGRALGDGRFMLYTFGNGSHALTQIALENGAWKVERELFPISFGEALAEGQPGAPKTWVTTHDETVFVWTPLVMGDTGYLVDVFEVPDSGSETQIMALRNRIDDADQFEGNWPYMISAARFGRKFAVMTLLVNPQTSDFSSRWIDIFSEQGDFVERRAVGKTVDMKPLEGSRQAVLVDGDTMVASVLD